MKTYFPKFDQSLNNFFIKYKIGNVQRTPEGKHGFISMIEANVLKVLSGSLVCDFHQLLADCRSLKHNCPTDPK